MIVLDANKKTGFPAPAMAYVPWQNWENLYNECDAFERGTAFPSLDLPFTGKGGILR